MRAIIKAKYSLLFFLFVKAKKAGEHSRLEDHKELKRLKKI